MKFCPQCGADVHEASRFCSKCGLELSETDTDQSAAAVQTGARRQQGSAPTYVTIGWICCVISLVFIPVIFGAITVIMGYLTRKVDEQHGTILMIAGVAGAIFGMLLGAAVGGSYYY
ncbi:zinc-ribbon domain-containing protein [Virgibacillus xinjiangensis]|uniref:Zinc-ribbon domain-containing protein n=1 Tax=Virgibacillus xinjiangensis TaxID=393090 RepID=A0ABV7CWR6_9BACI